MFSKIESSNSGNASGFSASSATPAAAATDYSQYYDPSTYWQASAGGYGAAAVAAAASGWPAYDQTAASQTDYAAYYQQQAVAHAQNALAQQNGTAAVAAVAAAPIPAYDPEEDEMALVGECYWWLIHSMLLDFIFDIWNLLIAEHKVPVDVEQMNRELLERDRSLWDALESSKWLPIEQLESY